ncbi:peroxide stress protein YaaA [Acidaminococcus fermentans]|uniref:peroxide stress protein YaaA n=1 Tax=Acidaminococcus fermentans TaxID=905 RepID=UPI00242F8868|nr:peroxide stress protein YaaA [Acidaminococcus fermentans]MCI7194888.1 peroxide stress protein YaaA [Acidaminococcus fermentans]MDY2852806.1 peroxide stress protein YaaA [Acidaminococcus fermentans]
MRLIISPAKKMRVDLESGCACTPPFFLPETRQLLSWLRSLSFGQLRTLWACSQSLAEENWERLRQMDLEKAATPALLAYEGIQYQYMAPAVFEDGQMDWVGERVRILSGFYGALRPFDRVVPYRLEMQAKGAPEGFRNLYDFWGDRLYRACRDEDGILINLASKEYSRAVAPYLQPEDRLVEVIFGEQNGERIVQKGVYAKMARGEMVRYLAGKGARRPEDMKDFCWSGYVWDPERSRPDRYVFLRQPSARG